MKKEEQPVIVIKKASKIADEPFHGGSWKIAYADFMTTLMTFFLVMWLLTVAKSQKERQEVSGYYKTYNFFPLSQHFKKPLMVKSYQITQNIPVDPEALNIVTPAEIKKKLMEVIEALLADLKDNITITEVEEGVRIDIADPQGNVMFTLGSPELRKDGRRILGALSGTFRGFDNKIVIEGHTDAIGYPNTEYTNWELSTERASSARKELQTNKVAPTRIAMVAGYGSTRPIIADDPFDPRNRRISILILYPRFINTAAPAQNAEASPPSKQGGH